MTTELLVFIAGQRTGVACRQAAPDHHLVMFRDDYSYIADPANRPLSLRLPVDAGEYEISRWLDGLLPDNPGVRTRWAAQQQAAAPDAMSLLSTPRRPRLRRRGAVLPPRPRARQSRPATSTSTGTPTNRSLPGSAKPSKAGPHIWGATSAPEISVRTNSQNRVRSRAWLMTVRGRLPARMADGRAHALCLSRTGAAHRRPVCASGCSHGPSGPCSSSATFLPTPR